MASQIPSELIECVRRARHVAVLTGAGISAESGIPTFRDAQTGLWARFRAQDLATAEAFEHNPKLVWEWYAWRREMISQCEPNDGHRALVTLETDLRQVTIITQNVDSLHHRAGSREVIELHGNIMRNKCFREGVVIDTLPPGDEVPPRCPNCGARVRPDVVWFGEMLPPEALAAAERAAQTCDVFMVVGTSAEVYPAASLPLLADSCGAKVIEVNPHETPLSTMVHWSLRYPAGQALPAIAKRLAQ